MESLIGEEGEDESGEDLRDAHSEAFSKLIEEAEAMEGASELIAELDDAGATVILASSAQQDALDHYVELLGAAGGAGKGRVGRIAVSYDEDRDAALKRPHEQFRWFGLGWKVMADLPNPDSFDAAAQFVTLDDVAESIPCGPDVAEHVEKIRSFIDAGFTEVALVQIGGDQKERFTAWAERELLPVLREL